MEGDALDVLRGVPDGTYTCVVTDPPYGLSTPPDPLEVMRQWLADGDFVRKNKRGKGPGGFMGAAWDTFVPGPVLWREVYRVCKPGAIVLCFAATRTMDWMALSLRLAGFEILDVIAWLQAQGMAKAGTIDKRIDERNGDKDKRAVVGAGAARCSFLERGEACKCGEREAGENALSGGTVHTMATAPASAESAKWAGWSTGLAPGYEPVWVARRPCEGSATENVLMHGCGAMNIDACRIAGESTRRTNSAQSGYQAGAMGGGMPTVETYQTGSDAGRWPKNVLLSDGAAEVLDEQVGKRTKGRASGYNWDASAQGVVPTMRNIKSGVHYGDEGGPSRFFWVGPMATEDDCALPGRYVPKVRTGERHAGLPPGFENSHPTVKPIALMEWLCRLVGHPEGRGLDPFAGSGSTLRAARRLGLAFDGIERDPEFAKIARHRAQVEEAPSPAAQAPSKSPTPPPSLATDRRQGELFEGL